MKDIFVIGGPNGAGKTTAAKELLPNMLNVNAFVNADEIAREMSPHDVDKAALAAGRAMLKRMADLVAKGETFALRQLALRNGTIAFCRNANPMAGVSACYSSGCRQWTSRSHVLLSGLGKAVIPYQLPLFGGAIGWDSQIC